MTYLMIILGLLLLVIGGDVFVRGSVKLARILNISPLLIGITLVGFGTSTPELITSIQAAYLNSPGLVIGNVIGSNIANILLILGLTALIWPLKTNPAAFKRDGLVILVSTILCVMAILYGQLTQTIGIAFVVLLILYLVLTYFIERKSHDASANMHEHTAGIISASKNGTSLALLLTAGGFVMIFFGARFLVTGSIDMARTLGISETIIGLTIVAVGTSLPELITSVIAAFRREADVAFGNIIGSNIYNILGILGITAIIQPIKVPPVVAILDIWIMLAATILLLIFAATRWSLSRFEGAIFFTGYVAYIGYLVLGAG